MPEERIAKKRCAIYCRKSVEEGLEQEFNSLDAQREAGEAYILSQKANGWVCLPEHYDDGGYSGGNMKRPALQKLLKDSETGLVDIIVVYKIDRLSRSICDFADLSKKFDEWGIQFVSVTQEINTATPSGRMMLNILVTFSQYEREITAQRISDKMSASRKKGIWVGGTVPLGYVAKNKKLVIHEEDAKTVRHIFQRFIETQSPKLIAHELNLAGKRTKKGKVWNTSHIYRILNNQTYNGEVKIQRKHLQRRTGTDCFRRSVGENQKNSRGQFSDQRPFTQNGNCRSSEGHIEMRILRRRNDAGLRQKKRPSLSLLSLQQGFQKSGVSMSGAAIARRRNRGGRQDSIKKDHGTSRRSLRSGGRRGNSVHGHSSIAGIRFLVGNLGWGIQPPCPVAGCADCCMAGSS